MKYVSIFYLLLFSFFAVAQEKETPAIKIYVVDDATGKNCNDAKLTLEGFEIPAIVGQYNKNEKYYYFDAIPTGYNTIIAYHKKFNEKGFQNIHSLPRTLTLRLYNPLHVSYSFESNTFKNTYVEDPYKISITTNKYIEYNILKDFINLTINDLKLPIELVNPYLEVNEVEANPYPTSQVEAYPNINFKENEEVKGDYLFPLKGGVSTLFPDQFYSNKSKDICFILRKKDGSKFKRFNDPIIKKLKAQEFKVYSIVLNKKNGTDFNKSFRIKDHQNKKYNYKNTIDSSKVFFYDNNFRNDRKSLGIFKFFKKEPYLQFDEPNKFQQLPSFILIANEKRETYNLFSETGKENPKIYKTPFLDEALGLGILDVYEYYSQIN